MTHPGRGLRTLRNKLALLFLLITALALAAVIFIFLPQLRSKLDAQELHDLAVSARSASPRIGSAIGRDVTGPEITRLVRSTADSLSARVTLFGIQESAPPTPPRFYVLVDSGEASTAAPDWALVSRSALARPGSRPLATRSGETGHVAVPLFYRHRPAWVVLYTRRFADAANVVTLVRNRLLDASAAALLVALVGGYVVALRLTRRVHRLDVAARELAAGRQIDPLPVDSTDEIGRLTRSFNEMQHQLKQVERARREFIANASHELRTPIFSLGGFLELLADEDLDEETRRQFLEQLRGQVDRMRKLATELLDLSRLESGALELRPEPTDVGQLAREVAAEFTPAAQRHESIVVLELHDDPIELDCDPERVAQVLRILLDNALVHTPAGTGVRVSADRRNGHVRLEVSDRGLGIKRQNMPHIFEPFFTSNEEAQGAGLGLAIARELAERMQGRLTVRSAPGSTTFSLVLPV
jgi:two-component system OmpR family sensor kinase